MSPGPDLDVDERVRSTLASVPRHVQPPPESWTTIEATAERLRARRSRRQRLVWAACLVLVPLLALSLVNVTTLHPAGPFAPSDLGLTDIGGARTGFGPDGDRTVVVTFVGGSPFLPDDDPCWAGYALTTSDDGASVAVALRREGPSWFVRARNRSVDCTMEGYPRSESVELSAPLAGRPLVDRMTGKPVPVFDGATLLRPTTLPPDWWMQREGGGPIAGGVVWTRQYGTVESSNTPTGLPSIPRTLSIEQLPPAVDFALQLPPGATVTDRPAVRGTTADYYDTGNTRSLTWIEGDQRVVVSTSVLVVGQPMAIDEAQLIAIAEGLVPEG